MAVVLSDPLAALNPVIRIGAQVAESLVAHRLAGRSAAAARATELLASVGLRAEVLRSYPHQLSGGMRQRALIAAALACEPALLIADEPTSALDPIARAQLSLLLRRLGKERGISLLIATHDLPLARELCDRALVLHAGRLVESGPVAQLLASPRHPYTAALLRSVPPELGGPAVARLEPVAGTAPALSALPGGCRFRLRCARAQPDCAAQEPEPARAGAREVACFHPLEVA
jgi:oligopeptide/dipeptide ABC transporter ATP-binding protein